jgi:hypothetical protein
VTDLGGPTMFARMGMMRALNGGTSTRATRSSGPRKKFVRGSADTLPWAARHLDRAHTPHAKYPEILSRELA